jgi:hypothetical protein
MLRHLMTSSCAIEISQKNKFNYIISSRGGNQQQSRDKTESSQTDSEDVTSTIGSDMDSNYSDEMNIPLSASKCLNCASIYISQYSTHSDKYFCSRDCSSCYRMFHKLPEERDAYATDQR